MEAQSNFEYLQNLIVRPLTYAAAPYAAIIEESFPAAAMMDEAVFLDAADDRSAWPPTASGCSAAHSASSMKAASDLIPTSQYDFKRLAQ